MQLMVMWNSHAKITMIYCGYGINLCIWYCAGSIALTDCWHGSTVQILNSMSLISKMWHHVTSTKAWVNLGSSKWLKIIFQDRLFIYMYFQHFHYICVSLRWYHDHIAASNLTTTCAAPKLTTSGNGETSSNSHRWCQVRQKLSLPTLCL